MKKTFILYILLVGYLANCQIKNLSITYGCTYNVKAEDRMIDSEKLKNEHPEIYEETIQTDSLVNFITFKLIYKDSISLSYGNKPINIELMDVYNDFEGSDSIYSSLKTDEILIYKKDYWGKNLLLNYKYKNYSWYLTNETKLINQTTCYKATLTYNTEDKKNTYQIKVTAWYNPQINIPIGPKGFGGLPGVILELDDGYRTYYPKEISINKNDFKIDFNIPKKIEKISLDDFRRTYDDMKREYKNFIFEN
jgi:GLPGLI family protein